jgi:multiple sugar transport system substrate-binding protein
MKKNLFLAFLFVLVCAMFFAGCSRGANRESGTTGGSKTELSLWFGNWWEEKSPGIKTDFEAAYPQYTLKIENLPIAGYFDNAAVAILAGSPPDILDIDVTQISSFASRNLLTDITQSVGGKLNADDFLSASWSSSHFEEKMYGMPSRASGGVYYYNKTMFDEAGVPYPTDSWNYSDFLAVAQKITVPGQKYGAGIAADPSDPSNVFSSFAPVLWAHKGDFLSADGKKCIINSPEGIQAITFWTELYTKYHVVPDGSVNFTTARDLLPLFDQNKVALLIYGVTGIEVFSKNPSLKWGLVQGPAGANRAGGWTLTIPVSAAHPEGAVDFLLWYARPEVQSKHSCIEPSNKAAWDLGPPWNGPDQKQFMTAANNGKTLPTVGAWGEASKVVITELQNVLQGSKTPQQGANDIVAQIDPLL